MLKFFDVRPTIYKLSDRGIAFFIYIGGRGIGKTYSSLQYVAENDDKKFIYLRRTQKELDICASISGNPFKKINDDKGYNYSIKKAGELQIIRNLNKPKNEDICGYGLALSTFSSIKGVDFSDVSTIIFDEFTVPSNKSPIKKESDSFFDLYETVNRNREMQGEPPVIVIMLSNATNIASPILSASGLLTNVEQMVMHKQKSATLWDKSAYIALPEMQEFREEKANTVLYRFTEGTQYHSYALDNDFAYDSFYNVAKQKIREYRPLCSVDGIYIYKHKSLPLLYACRIYADCPSYSLKDSYSLFIRNHGFVIREYIISGKMFFSDYATKIYLTELLKV